MSDALLLRRPLVEQLLTQLASFGVDEWHALAGHGCERREAYRSAMERVHAAAEISGPTVQSYLADVDARIDELWRDVADSARLPTSTDLTGDFAWLMAKSAARALLLRHIAGLGAAGFAVLYSPFERRESAAGNKGPRTGAGG